LAGGYFINEAATDNFMAATDKLRNDIIETDLKYFNRALKSITVIQNGSLVIPVVNYYNKNQQYKSYPSISR